MTYLRSISRFAVVLLALSAVSIAAVPAGWIALRYSPPAGEDEKGHWILVKAPEDGLAAWWSDEELARIAAGDEDYVKQVETDWSPVDHPAADSDEAERLSEELARYWGGDIPQANYWAHGALTRRGATLRAFRWEQDGLTQRSDLEQAGQRPGIAAAAVDPSPVDARYLNGEDVVSYGDRWGDHLRSGTLDHVHRAERNRLTRQRPSNPPTMAEVEQAASWTVRACREASLKAEMGVFSNYVRAWGGLSAQNVSFGLPANCVVDPGPGTPSPPPVTVPPLKPPAPKPPSPPPVSVPPLIPIAPEPPTKPVTPAPDPKPPTTPVSPPPSPKPPKPTPKPPTTPVSPPPSPKPPKPTPKPPTTPVTPPPKPNPPSNPVTPPPVTPPAPPSNPVTPPPVTPQPDPPSPPEPEPPEPNPYTACDGSKHSTQAEADAVKCTYTDCKGNTHDSQAKADAVRCDAPPAVQPPDDDPKYTACDGTLHHSQEEADAIKCRGEETDELCDLDPFAAGCDQF